MTNLENGLGFNGLSNEFDRSFEAERFTRVKQAVVAAGGKGTRISPELNPNGSKVLIEHSGKTLFEHQLDSLIVGGVEKLIVSTAYHTDRKIRDIVKAKNIDAVVIPISEMGSFRWIPYYMQDLLDDRFMFVCGHQPLDPDFVREMLNSSQKSRFVASGYESDLFVTERANNLKIRYDTNLQKLEIGSQSDKKTDGKLLIDSPYILSKDMVLEFTDNNGQGEYSNYILGRYLLGETLTVVKSQFPPEFDFDEELERTLHTIRQNGSGPRPTIE